MLYFPLFRLLNNVRILTMAPVLGATRVRCLITSTETHNVYFMSGFVGFAMFYFEQCIYWSELR